ncbi:MAG TPA: hypothetical protein PJ994_04115 [Tepidiformaceae bacterium]|nr:hypothetical protein [Tepidiformaceae bacterium]
MTLALTGKSRRRQTTLVLAAFLALLAAIAGGLATRDAQPALATDNLYRVTTFALIDHTAPDGTFRPGEFVSVVININLIEGVATDGFAFKGSFSDNLQAASYEKAGKTETLKCSVSILAFSCEAEVR